jgi:hypothetical protein
MAVSALAGVFREFTVTKSTVTGSTVDADGAIVETVTTTDFTILFKPSESSHVIFREGADPRVVAGTGRLLDPVAFPTDVQPGTELTMTLNGKAGVLRILSISLSSLEVIDTILGQKFTAEWRAT